MTEQTQRDPSYSEHLHMLALQLERESRTANLKGLHGLAIALNRAANSCDSWADEERNAEAGVYD